MKRPGSLIGFFVRAAAGFLVLVLLWLPVSGWLARPVGWLGQAILEEAAPDWVRRVDRSPGPFEVETRVAVAVAEAPGRRADLVAEADPARYAYGLPLFLALLLASGGRRLLRRALAGYVLLLLPQTASLVFAILRQIIGAAAGGPAALGIGQWQMEVIAIGYQFSVLLLPTLAPAALWLWFDRSFLSSLVVSGWLERRAAIDGDHGPV